MFEPDAKSVLWGISPTLLIVGGVYHIISIATPYWLANSQAHLGLWNYCTVDGKCFTITEKLNSNDHTWFRTVQGLEIAATVFVISAAITGLMRINLGQSIWQIACGLSAILAGLLAVSGVVVFAKNYGALPNQTISWAFIFNAVSSAMALLAGPVLILDSMLHRF